MAIAYDDLFRDLGEVVQLVNNMVNSGTSVRANTAQSGTSTTITLDTGASTIDDTYNRMTVLITSGDGIGQIRTITDYTGSSRQATVDRVWVTNPASDSVFAVKKDWVKDMEIRFDEIGNEFRTNGELDLLEGLNTLINGLKNTVVGQSQTIAGLVTSRLQHKTTILDQLPQIAGSTSISKILFNLIRQMNDDSKTVEISTLRLGTVAEDKANTNAGTLICDATLDGVTAPSANMAFNPEYKDELSELASIETFTVECTSGSETGASIGSEIFSITGGKSRTTPWDWQTNGSGAGSNLSPVQGTGMLSNNDFETFTVADTPDGWTINTGTAGTHILEATSAGDIYHGSAALGLVGDASLAAIKLSVDFFPVNSLTPLKRYVFACYVKGNASLSAGRLLIRLEDGSGVQVGTTEIDMDTSAIAAQTSFGRKEFYVTMPAVIPDDTELVITLDGTPSAHSIYVDWMGFGPVTYHGGVNFAMVAGADIFLKGDRYKMTTEYTATGVFQDFFREFFRVQLPSAVEPSFADTLATD